MNKRGQFYLVAAIIIVSIVASLITITNYAKKNQTILVNDFAKELKIETQKVLEYDISNSDNKINQYGMDYSNHSGSNIELYFIIGNNPNINAYKYLNGYESDANENLQLDTINNKIIFNLYGTNHTFDLREGNNFYFLILQNIKGEIYVKTL